MAAESISYQIVIPDELRSSDWRAMQAVAYDAYIAGLPRRTSGEIMHFTQMNHPEEFAAFRINPNRSVAEGRLNPNQSFGRTRIAIATHNATVVGYGSAANNTSGRTAAERWAKMHLTTEHRVVWLAELVVGPQYQRQRIGTRLAGLLLAQFKDEQPVSTYTWRENKAGMGLAQALGFVVTDPSIPVRPFGDSAGPAEMVRWERENRYVQAAVDRILAD